MDLHTNFSIFRRSGFFFVYDKGWPNSDFKNKKNIGPQFQC